jgi:hypothetical protein
MKLFHTDFRVVLRITTREGDPPPAIVLCRVLKALLRCFDVQCRDVAEAPGDSSEGDKPPGV